MRVARVPFSVLLPLVELALWAALILIPTSLLFYRLRQAAEQSEPARIHLGHFEVTLRRDQLFGFAVSAVARTYSHTITAINFPGASVEILISLPTTWPSVWHPTDVPNDSWRSLSYPFFCLPAWWLVGRGIDGSLRRSHLHWALTLIGSVLFLGSLALLVGFCFGPGRDIADLGWIRWGLGFWVTAFGLLPLSWLRQRGARREKDHAA